MKLRVDIKDALDGRVLVITGAGLSADSGLQTFRGVGGLWRNYNPMTLATLEAFARDPKLVWEWYQWRRAEAAKATPNAAHLALARLARRQPECLIVTQNVDDLHERANTPMNQLVHVHGNLFSNRCQTCEYSDNERIHDDQIPPRCPKCRQRLLRPGVVWFGEGLDSAVLRRIDDFLRAGKCSLALAIGTTASFPYIIDWQAHAKRQGALLIEVNPEETPLSEFADAVYRERAAEALPKLLNV
ncbi:MAG TPA: NAD-dependent protein deacylase [Terriglobales bacterium]|nr:NAD-dependent protein deacylase [Terriglobales bacterium]